jgi:hypothetical protein
MRATKVLTATLNALAERRTNKFVWDELPAGNFRPFQVLDLLCCTKLTVVLEVGTLVARNSPWRCILVEHCHGLLRVR